MKNERLECRISKEDKDALVRRAAEEKRGLTEHVIGLIRVDSKINNKAKDFWGDLFKSYDDLPLDFTSGYIGAMLANIMPEDLWPICKAVLTGDVKGLRDIVDGLKADKQPSSPE